MKWIKSSCYLFNVCKIQFDCHNEYATHRIIISKWSHIYFFIASRLFGENFHSIRLRWGRNNHIPLLLLRHPSSNDGMKHLSWLAHRNFVVAANDVLISIYLSEYIDCFLVMTEHSTGSASFGTLINEEEDHQGYFPLISLKIFEYSQVAANNLHLGRRAQRMMDDISKLDKFRPTFLEEIHKLSGISRLKNANIIYALCMGWICVCERVQV